MQIPTQHQKWQELKRKEEELNRLIDERGRQEMRISDLFHEVIRLRNEYYGFNISVKKIELERV